MGDATLLERAVNTLPAIEKLLPLEKDIDIIRGHAGLLKVLTNLYQAYPNDEVKRVLQSSTDQFLSELGNTVLQEDSMRSAGFAHGLSGIVFSLAHVQSVLSSHAIEQTVIELLRIENEFYVEASRKWLDLRENKHALASNYWCHGSYGILLARAHIGSLLPDVPTELLLIDRLMEDVLEEQSGPIGHSMCHGEVGNRNIIMDVRSLVSGREPVDTENVAQFNRIPGQLWQTGMHPDIESLGLFTGLSGIGLGLLRFLDPKIPSILSLDIPKYEEVICS